MYIICVARQIHLPSTPTVLNNPITKVRVVCLKECSEDIVCSKCMEPVHISCSEDYVSEDEVEQKICKLCFNELNVQREREMSKKCLEIRAKKMKLMSDKSHSEASVGFTVCIPVPEVDRGKGDAKSILAIIIKITEEGFFQLGTRNGRIKQLYSGMIEFANTRLADLFSVSTSKDYTVNVLSKPTVVTEVMQLKRSMYDDPQGFIFKNFEILCNLLKNFGEYDESLKISALKVLLQVSEKVTSLLSTFLDDDEFDQEDLFKKRNTFKMAVFLLCHFANAFEKQLSQKLTAASIEKGRRKKINSISDTSEWPELRVKFVVVIKKLFKLPINKLWDPPSVDPEFVNFVTITFFKLLERAEVAKDKGMRAEIFRFHGTVLTDYQIGLAFSVKMIQLVQDFEHLSSVLAEGVVYFVKECSADTLISDTLKEANLLDVDVLTQNLTAAHSLSHFLVSIAEECPDKFLPLVSLVLQFLEWESHIMRNCALSILGVLLSKTLSSENLSEKEKNMREELLGQIEECLLDGNSFVRCRCIQVLKMLMETKALASFELHIIGQKITKRLQDKASNVRKNAMTFMAEFVHENQCSCQFPLPVLKESFETELEKLKELKKKVPVIFEDSEEEEVPDKQEKVNGVIFSDSEEDDAATDKEKGKNEADSEPISEQSKESGELSEGAAENSKDKSEKELQKNIPPSSEIEALKQQQNLVNYLKNTLNFAEVIHSILDPIRSLLYSSTQTDVLESIEFIIAIVNNSVKGADTGIKEVLKLIWSKEAAIIEAVRNAFKTLYLSNGQDKCDPMDITKNLIELLKGASTDDALNIQECVKHFSELNEIPKSVSNILWSSFSNPKSELTEEENISILQLLGMLTEIHPDTVLMRLDNFVEIGLGKSAENSFLLAMYVFKTLGKINHNIRGKITPKEEIHFPHSHLLVSRIKYFLIDGIKNYEDNQWTCMAQEAVFTIFSLIEEPDLLCAEISKTLSNILLEEIHAEKIDGINNDDENNLQKLPHILLSRFLTFCGYVAIHYNSYLKVDHFTYLRKQEAIREKRRRRSSVHNNVSFNSTSFLSPTRKSGRKRKSIINNKRYKLMPPVDEETTYEQIIEMCAKSVQSDEKLVGALLQPIILFCRWSLKVFNKEIQAAASFSLAKFMLLSEQVCQENMQLFATIAEKSPEAYIRANMIIAMGDLATAYPNTVEPWTQQIFQKLKDSDSLVRENAIIILTHLILHDFVRIKALISDAAKCIADNNPSISSVAKYLFAELSKKGNVIYNIIPDIISSLSDPKSGVDEEIFQTIMSFMLQYVEKDKLIEGLVEKLCCRFTESNTEIQIHELTFCLSILTLNDKCYRKLMEFKTLLKERMSDPVVMRYITNIIANAKKNDAKTAAELETFKNELGL